MKRVAADMDALDNKKARDNEYNKYMFNFIDIYIFIPVSDCVGRVPGALFCLGAYNAVKTALVVSQNLYFN
jgi:hypothetical protein